MRHLECPRLFYKFTFINKDKNIVWNYIHDQNPHVNKPSDWCSELFLDLSATSTQLIDGSLKQYPIWFLKCLPSDFSPWHSGHCLSISIHGLPSSKHSLNVGVSQTHCVLLAMSIYFFLGDFMSLNAMCANTSKSYVFIVNLLPECQTNISNCLLNISVWLMC